MAKSSIPSKQEDLRTYMNNCAAQFVSNPARFALMMADALSFKERADYYSAALDVVLVPATRNVATLTVKNGARASLLQLARPVLQRIRDNEGISAQDKALIGVVPPDRDPTVVPAPATKPVLEVAGIDTLVHHLRYHDETTPTSRAKAHGTTGLLLFRAVAETPPAGPDAARFVATVTRQNFLLEFDAAEARKTAYYWARWQNGKGQVGPWSEMIAATIAA